MLSVHADAAIGDDASFRSALASAADGASAHRGLCTVGIVPTEPNPGLGYIAPGESLGADVSRVARFIEKPDRARAERLVAKGCLWNSGIFAWQAATFLDEVRAHTLELHAALAAAEHGRDAFFAAVETPVSVDVGILERSAKVLVIPGRFGWDDVGTWGALRRVRNLDAAGNAIRGKAHAVDARGNVVHASRGRVVLFGVQDLVVVTHGDITLVTTVEHADRLKTLLDALPPDLVTAP